MNESRLCPFWGGGETKAASWTTATEAINWNVKIGHLVGARIGQEKGMSSGQILLERTAEWLAADRPADISNKQKIDIEIEILKKEQERTRQLEESGGDSSKVVIRAYVRWVIDELFTGINGPADGKWTDSRLIRSKGFVLVVVVSFF